MSKAQFRRIIKGSWSNTNDQKKEDSIEQEQEANIISQIEEDIATS
jgi:hypothetical protein